MTAESLKKDKRGGVSDELRYKIELAKKSRQKIRDQGYEDSGDKNKEDRGTQSQS